MVLMLAQNFLDTCGFWIVICRQLANTYTCAHVRTHANFVSHRSLIVQDLVRQGPGKGRASPG